MLEFGLVGNFLPLLTFAKVEINNKCYIKGCDPLSYEVEFTLTNEDRCVQVGLMFLEKNKIFYAFSPTCQKISTAFFESSKYIEMKRNRCYAVDPNRGAFWNKIECWDYLTISDFPSNNKGLDFVILKKFGGHEDYRFPVANDDWTLDEVYPPYFDKNGMPLPRELVQKSRNPKKETENVERYGCALI
ncbi:hypothetical protein Anas_06092 [Armadillidium nasatum]|uniref:Uncharacterized protein n=1 Tax=Armadillidium nasatum TaxID=96803 RepID=A0A5N5TEV6_9CRUS|nr:hypothetical protein Anas_06092 [Armadillidium nasatum]